MVYFALTLRQLPNFTISRSTDEFAKTCGIARSQFSVGCI